MKGIRQRVVGVEVPALAGTVERLKRIEDYEVFWSTESKIVRRIGVDVARDSIRWVEVDSEGVITGMKVHTRKDSLQGIIDEVAGIQDRETFRGATVYVAVSAQEILSHVELIPNHEDHRARQVRISKLASELVSLDAITYDYIIAPSENSQQSILFMAFVRSSMVHEICTLIDELGGTLEAIDIDVLALFRLWRHHDASVVHGKTLLLHVEDNGFRFGMFDRGMPLRLRAGFFSTPQELGREVEAFVGKKYDAVDCGRKIPARAIITASGSHACAIRSAVNRMNISEVLVRDLLEHFPIVGSVSVRETVPSLLPLTAAAALTVKATS